MRNEIGKLLSSAAVATAFLIFTSDVGAQSRPQRPDPSTTNQKKNQRIDPEKTDEQKRQEAEARKAVVDPEVLTISTNVVNVDAVVYEKKSGRIITGLKAGNFAVFENGVRRDIANFNTPDAPITVSVLVEYSKWSEIFGYYANRGYESGKLEVVRPVAAFLTRFIKPPDDFASLIAFDIRPTPITDFTNDPGRLRASVDILLRSSPAFRENNLFDSLRFALVGGKADSVVLERSDNDFAQYGGMVDVKAKRKAIILVASGINTFSKTNFDETRRVIQEAGVPIYILSTGNLFYKMYEGQLGAADGIDGSPGRLTFLQAQNTMNTFAKESGGAHFPITFEGEINGALQSINALLRNQYSLAYEIEERPKDGKRYKLEVKVDVDGDGTFDDKQYVVQHRPFVVSEKAKKK